MGDQKNDDDAASLRIGPTNLGMVRIIVDTGSGEVLLDFYPDEAEEIAEELRAAAEQARGASAARGKKPRR